MNSLKEKVGGRELAKFFADFYSCKKHMHQRLGQAFCNRFGIHDEFLFYEEDDKTATELLSRYCK